MLHDKIAYRSKTYRTRFSCNKSSTLRRERVPKQRCFRLTAQVSSFARTACREETAVFLDAQCPTRLESASLSDGLDASRNYERF